MKGARAQAHKLALGLALALALACGGADAPRNAEDRTAAASEIILATTTSFQDSGLLDVLVRAFQERTGHRVKPIAVGSGAALEMARRGEADAVMAHAPDAELEYIRAGDLIEGRRIMHNDFLIIGPPSDPARVRAQPTAEAAFAAIARSATFVSRGDRSGTELMELGVWQKAGIDADTLTRGRIETGQGMGATLMIANERNAYTLTDRGTYLALSERLQLVPHFENGASLINVYHAYVVNPERHPRVNARGGRAFVEFLASPEAQRLIGRHGVEEFGQPLFAPDAEADTLAIFADTVAGAAR